MRKQYGGLFFDYDRDYYWDAVENRYIMYSDDPRYYFDQIMNKWYKRSDIRHNVVASELVQGDLLGAVETELFGVNPARPYRTRNNRYRGNNELDLIEAEEEEEYEEEEEEEEEDEYEDDDDDDDDDDDAGDY